MISKLGILSSAVCKLYRIKDKIRKDHIRMSQSIKFLVSEGTRRCALSIVWQQTRMAEHIMSKEKRWEGAEFFCNFSGFITGNEQLTTISQNIVLLCSLSQSSFFQLASKVTVPKDTLKRINQRLRMKSPIVQILDRLVQLYCCYIQRMWGLGVF